MKTFNLTVFGHKYGHNDTYGIQFLPDGWDVSHISIGGKCDKKGDPFLFRNLLQDSIEYPSSLGFKMEEIHEKIESGNYDEEQIQSMLDEIGTWIDKVSAVNRPIFE